MIEANYVGLAPEHLVLEPKARQWCTLPYPDHPHGCPNFGKHVTCPPEAPEAAGWLTGTSTLWLAYVKFDLAAHVAKMQAQQPGWSMRQARCLLYWQPSVNKCLREFTEQLLVKLSRHGAIKATYCPEAMGIQVLQTANNAGIPIQQHPVNYIYKVALVAKVN
jgi:hypothetical protein